MDETFYQDCSACCYHCWAFFGPSDVVYLDRSYPGWAYCEDCVENNIVHSNQEGEPDLQLVEPGTGDMDDPAQQRHAVALHRLVSGGF
jgi:hypothetical protein